MIRRTITFTVGYDETDDPYEEKADALAYITGRWLYESITHWREELGLVVENKNVFDPDEKRGPKDLF